MFGDADDRAAIRGGGFFAPALQPFLRPSLTEWPQGDPQPWRPVTPCRRAARQSRSTRPLPPAGRRRRNSRATSIAAAPAIRSASSIRRSRRSGPTTRRPALRPRSSRSRRRDGKSAGVRPAAAGTRPRAARVSRSTASSLLSRSWRSPSPACCSCAEQDRGLQSGDGAPALVARLHEPEPRARRPGPEIDLDHLAFAAAKRQAVAHLGAKRARLVEIRRRHDVSDAAVAGVQERRQDAELDTLVERRVASREAQRQTILNLNPAHDAPLWPDLSP